MGRASGGEHRRATRYRSRIRVRLRVRSRAYEGFILDVSEGGMRLSTDGVVEMWAGDVIEVDCPELGLLTGTVRWRSPGKFGLKFDDSTNTAAKIEHFKKYLGPSMN